MKLQLCLVYMEQEGEKKIYYCLFSPKCQINIRSSLNEGLAVPTLTQTLNSYSSSKHIPFHPQHHISTSIPSLKP